MAEENVSSASEPDSATDLTRSRRRTAAAPVSPRRTGRLLSFLRPRGSAPRSLRPVRSALILTMVVGLFATVAIPAYAATQQTTETQTLQQVAADNAQSLVVASDATETALERGGYSATTPEEIDKKKAEAAAAERARAAATTASAGSASLSNIDLSMVAPGSGAVRWPLASYTLGDGFRSRGGAHMGIDMLIGGGTPIYATAAGVVRVSQESYGGYGNAVTIDHDINGQKVGSLYGHMTSGSRLVQVGDTVQAGQIIGLVGSTGRSTANHLHFEVYVNGTNVDPLAWLQANAG